MTAIEVVAYPGHYQPVGVVMTFDTLSFGASMTSEEARVLGEEMNKVASEVEET